MNWQSICEEDRYYRAEMGARAMDLGQIRDSYLAPPTFLETGSTGTNNYSMAGATKTYTPRTFVFLLSLMLNVLLNYRPVSSHII